MKYNKLIRDRIPEIIEEKGGTYKIHIADDNEYWEKLRKKLVEEVEEFLENEDKDEIADMLEVIYAILEYKNVSKEEIEEIRTEKAEKRGVFNKKLILEESEDSKTGSNVVA